MEFKTLLGSFQKPPQGSSMRGDTWLLPTPLAAARPPAVRAAEKTANYASTRFRRQGCNAHPLQPKTAASALKWLVGP